MASAARKMEIRRGRGSMVLGRAEAAPAAKGIDHLDHAVDGQLRRRLPHRFVVTGVYAT